MADDRAATDRRAGRVATDASAPDFRLPDTRAAAVDLVVRIAQKARTHGPESLAEDAARADNELLRHGLAALAAGRPHAEIQAAMGREVTGAAADLGGSVPARRIVEAGLMMIKDGQDPAAIRTNLESLLATEPGPTGR